MTTSAGISDLYNAVITDLIPFYSNAVLLPNSALIPNSLNIAEGAGDTVQFPLQDSFSIATSGLAENANVVGAGNNFTTSASPITAVKRGSGTFVTEESLEDGQFDVVRNAVVSQLSRSVAQATDQAGFATMLNNVETTDWTAGTGTDANTLTGVGANALLINQATIGGATGLVDLNTVFSPQAMGYMSKRDITAKMEEDVQFDRYIMTGTVRNGFGQLRQDFIKVVGSIAGSLASANNVDLADFAQAVALLRAGNAPADASGFYYAAITPQVEYLLSSELNGVGGTGASSIGSLSDIGNRALLDAVISEAIGIRWLRSNALVTGVTNTIA
tara:strand:- start:98 stop:1090 length:993 start_codon:yes stop_codon:yes gene_type:complete